MRHHDMTGGLLDLLFKNHFELLDRTRRLPLGFAPLPFAVELQLGNQGRGTSASSVQLQLRDGVLLVNVREDERTLEFRAPLVSLSNPGSATPVSVTLGDRDGKKTHSLPSTGLAGFKVPDAFKSLQDKLVRHLQTLFPSLSEAGKAKSAADEAIGQASGSSSAAAADTDAAKPSESAAPAPQEYRTFIVQRHNQPDLRFEGKLVAGVQSALFRGRSYVFCVYETKGGKLVGVKRGLSLVLGERDNLEAQVAATAQDLVSFFGYSPLAKALYEQLGVSTDEVIE